MPLSEHAARSQARKASEGNLRRQASATVFPLAVRHAQALCELTQALTHIDMLREPGVQLAALIARGFGMDAVAIFDRDLNRTYTEGQWYIGPENQLLNICMFEHSFADAETGLTAEVVRVGALPIGALLLRGEVERTIAGSIANLIAITFDRYHTRANLSRVEGARETERLRATVLDSLAHMYKTPLTAIRAAATGVVAIGALGGAQRELMDIVLEQGDVLNEMTMRLLTTAKLESQEMQLQLEWTALATVMDEAVAEARLQHPGLPLRISVAPEDLAMRCDRRLLSALLVQYFDNAAKYSEFGSLVTVSVQHEGDSVVFSVHNIGPAIPEDEVERIFERYARGSAAERNTSGTGLGLSIARSSAQAHAGDVWVTTSASEGTTFWASLPMHGRGAANV